MSESYDVLYGLVSQSVEIGGILIPARSLERHLGSFVLNLVIWNHDETFKISLVGSATPIFYREKYFLLCSRHQLSGVDLENVSIMKPDGSTVITSSGVTMFNDTEYTKDSDAYDIVAFDFSEPVAANPDLKRLFFKFDYPPPNTSNDKIVALILAGFPCQDQSYELEERNHIGLRKRVVVALPESQPSDLALLTLAYVRDLDFDPDGLSGGPAFVIQIVDDEFRAFLAGMQLRSGRKQARILKAGYLKDLLEMFFRWNEQP